MLAFNRRIPTKPASRQSRLLNQLGEFLTKKDIGVILKDLFLEHPRNSQPIPIRKSQIGKTQPARLLFFPTQKPQPQSTTGVLSR
jgi:hypothetical protein